MITFLKAIDIYGDQFSLNIDGKYKHKTVFGGISTILFGILLAALIIIFGDDFFFRLNPRIVSQREINKESQKIIPSTRNFPIAFRVEDVAGNFIDIRALGIKISASYVHSIRNQQETANLVNYHDFEPKKCKSIPAAKNNAIDPEFTLDNYYCIDWDEIKDFTPVLGGYWDESEVAHLTLQLNNCSKRGAEDCASVKEIRKIMGNETWFFALFYPSYSFSVESVDKPLISMFESFTMEISAYTKIIIDAQMQIATLIDDKGWIFKDKSVYQAVSQDKAQTIFSSILDDDIGNFKILEYTLYFGKASTKIQRSFVKIQEVVAEISGVIKIFSLIFRVSVKYYSNFDMMRVLITKVDKDSGQTSRFSGSTIVVSNIENSTRTNIPQISFLRYLLRIFYKRQSLEFKHSVSVIEKQFEVNRLMELFKKIEGSCAVR